MACCPEDNAVVLKVTVDPIRSFVLNAVSPSLKITVPVGRPAPGGKTLMVAEKMMLDPGNPGFADEVTVVAVLAVVMLAVVVGDMSE